MWILNIEETVIVFNTKFNLNDLAYLATTRTNTDERR